MFERIRNFYNNFSDSLSETLSERVLKSGKTDFTIWDGYKAFFGESFDVVNKNVFDPVKKPVKDAAKGLDAKVQAYINDGDNNNMTATEKAWNGFKGFGKMADKMVSAEGFVVAGGAALTGGAVLGALPETAAAATGVTLNAVGTIGGAGLVAKGTYDVATADTPEEAQKGGAEIGSGGMLLAATGKQTIKGVKNVFSNPKLSNTFSETTTSISPKYGGFDPKYTNVRGKALDSWCSASRKMKYGQQVDKDIFFDKKGVCRYKIGERPYDGKIAIEGDLGEMHSVSEYSRGIKTSFTRFGENGIIHKTTFGNGGKVLYKGVFDKEKCKELWNLSTIDGDLSFVTLRDYNAGIEKIYRGDFQNIIDKFNLYIIE